MVSGGLARLKVVVVDDDPQIRDVLGRCLTLFGASVTLCGGAFEGIREVEDARPDVILVDLVMPHRDGFDLLRDIKKLGPARGGDTPVIVVTGLRNPEVEATIREAGFGYLSKPFTPGALFNSIAKTLDELSPLKKNLSALPIPAPFVPTL
jgi:CheY-like chemotaxis protein